MSVCADRIAENMDVFDFELTEVEMTRIAATDTGAPPCSSTTAALLWSASSAPSTSNRYRPR